MLEEKEDGTKHEKSIEGEHQERPADKISDMGPQHGEHMQSRLLTKKQLSDMAFGIRELSKRLGRVKLMLKVKNIFVLTKLTDATLCAKAAELTKWLLDQKDAQYTVWVLRVSRNTELVADKMQIRPGQTQGPQILRHPLDPRGRWIKDKPAKVLGRRAL
jgi:hypothetical protein